MVSTSRSDLRDRAALILGRFARCAAFLVALSCLHLRADEACPPAYPDRVHIPNGCFVSATAYLARFAAEFPAERGVPFTVQPSYHPTPHTISLLSWRGAWWGRDEYFGVFKLGASVASNANEHTLRRLAERALERRARAELNQPGAAPAVPSVDALAAEGRREAVATAATLLPCASEVLWVTAGRDEFPVLFFQPAPGVVAVYTPSLGTSHAECAMTNPVTVVRAVMERLGRRGANVRREVDLAAVSRHATTVAVAGGAR